MKYLPNVENINMHRSNEYHKYLLEIKPEKYLTKVEKIEVDPKYNGEHVDLKTVYYHFRNSLKYVKILDTQEDTVLSTQYNGILGFLSQFKQLNHVAYSNYTENQVSVYQLQKTCPTLMNVEYLANHAPELKTEEIRFYNTNNLTRLHLNFHTLTSSYVDLLTYHLPPSVKVLAIIIANNSFRSWINEIGIERLVTLLKVMSNLTDGGSISFLTQPYISNEPENFQELTMTNLYQILHTIKGNKKTLCSVRFSEKAYHTNILFSNDGLIVDFGLHSGNMNKDYQKLPKIKLELLDKSVSISGPEMINSLIYNFSREDKKSSSEALMQTVVNFPYLEYAELRSHGHTFQFSNTKEDLLIEENGPKKLTGNPNKLTTTQDNLTFAKLSGFKPSSKYFELLNTYLPNLKYLIYGAGCYRLKNKKEYTVVDLTQFKKLETFYFDVTFLRDLMESDTFFIRIEYTDGETFNYQCEVSIMGVIEALPLDSLEDSKVTMAFKCNRTINQFSLYIAGEIVRMSFVKGVPRIDYEGIEYGILRDNYMFK